jgi:hypothetical protein
MIYKERFYFLSKNPKKKFIMTYFKYEWRVIEKKMLPKNDFFGSITSVVLSLSNLIL